jgi:polyhydroxyalkanoate synthesis regulator phasin
VTTEADLVDLIQEAYGSASLGLHRGHQDVESTLIDVLGISHEELHVRMETEGQNLAAVASDLGIDPQTLIDALVDARSSAIDSLLENGTITQEQADAYLDELEQAYTFRVTWDGQEATPTAEAVG